MGNFIWVVGSYTIEKYSGLAILWRPWKGRWWCCPFSLSPPSWRSIEDYTWNYLAPTPAGRRRQMSRGFHSEVRIAQQKLRPHNILKCYFHRVSIWLLTFQVVSDEMMICTGFWNKSQWGEGSFLKSNIFSNIVNFDLWGWRSRIAQSKYGAARIIS